MKRIRRQSGMVDLILIGVVLLAAIAVGGYVIFQQEQLKKATDAAGNGVIITGRKANRSHTNSLPKLVDGNLVVDELGVKFKPPVSLVDLGYEFHTIDSADGKVAFSTAASRALAPNCSFNYGQIGLLYKGKTGSISVGPDQPIELAPGAKKIGGYWYAFVPTQAVCVDNESYRAAISAQYKLLSSSIETTLQAK